MDRSTRFFIAQGLIERTRHWPSEALNELFELMHEIERKHDLVPKLTEAEEAEVAALEERIAAGERFPELDDEPRGPVEDYLPEPNESVLARLAALPEREQEDIFGIIAQLIDIDDSPFKLSLVQIANLRRITKEMDEGKMQFVPDEEMDESFRGRGVDRA